MSMPHLNFLDIWGSSFKSFKKVSNLKLNLKSKIEDFRKRILMFMWSSVPLCLPGEVRNWMTKRQFEIPDRTLNNLV